MNLTQLIRGLCVLIIQEKRPTCNLWVVSHMSAVCMVISLISTQVASLNPASPHYRWWVKCVIMWGSAGESRQPRHHVPIPPKQPLLSLNWWDNAAGCQVIAFTFRQLRGEQHLNFTNSSSWGLKQQYDTNSLPEPKRGFLLWLLYSSAELQTLTLWKACEKGGFRESGRLSFNESLIQNTLAGVLNRFGHVIFVQALSLRLNSNF